MNLLVAWQNNGPASPPLRQRVSGKRQLKGRNKRTEIGTPAESIPSTRQCNSPQQRASLSFFAAQKVKSLLTPPWVGHWRQDNERLSAATLTSPLLICNTSHYRPPKVALPLLRERTTHHLRPLSTTQRSDFFVEVISFCAAFVPAFLYRLQVQAIRRSQIHRHPWKRSEEVAMNPHQAKKVDVKVSRSWVATIPCIFGIEAVEHHRT